MSKLRVNAFTVSADGFGAGPDQGQDQPLGRGGEQLQPVKEHVSTAAAMHLVVGR